MNSEIAIRVSGLSKTFQIGKAKDETLQGSLGSLFKSKGSYEQFKALNNVSFEVKKGEVIGIIGKNGAGKSTLLKILSQITRPTEGSVEINGRIASLLEVGTGFHPELTGRENIFLNGTILGMTRKEVKAKFDEIVAFSGVEKFIDTPVKHYSSGMYVRLAFAVAAHLEPEILIIDEVLAVGDAEFQKKCLGKMKDVAGQGRTVIFVSHNMEAVKSLCERAVYLENGGIVHFGSIMETISLYKSRNKTTKATKANAQSNPFGNDKISLLNFQIESLLNADELTIDSGVKISVSFINKLEEINLACSLFIYNDDDIVISEIPFILFKDKNSTSGSFQLNAEIPPYTLNSGNYSISIIFAENQRHILLQLDNHWGFEITHNSTESTHSPLPGVLALTGNTSFLEINHYEDKNY
jgi:lipopolysaccharide transport system ATP-binding protein